MWQKILEKAFMSLAKTLFRMVLLPKLRVETDKAITNLSENVVSSDYNPITTETVHDIEDQARKAIDEVFAEFE